MGRLVLGHLRMEEPSEASPLMPSKMDSETRHYQRKSLILNNDIQLVLNIHMLTILLY